MTQLQEEVSEPGEGLGPRGETSILSEPSPEWVAGVTSCDPEKGTEEETGVQEPTRPAEATEGGEGH